MRKHLDVYIIIGFVIIGLAFLLVENYKEQYGYPYAYKCGKNIAGTVYAKYPDNVPGLGWI